MGTKHKFDCQNDQGGNATARDAIGKPNNASKKITPITPEAKKKLEVILEKHRDDLLCFSIWLLRSNASDAADLTQELSLALCEFVAKLCHEDNDGLWEFLNDEERVRKWIFGTVRILSIQRYRKGARFEKYIEYQQRRIQSVQNSSIQQQLIISELQVLLEQCSSAEQKVVELWAEGLPQDEIARLLGMRSRFVVCRLLAIARNRVNALACNVMRR